MSKTLEICVDSFASAQAAITGGADRLELCSALAVGGLTPSAALLAQIRAVSNVKIRCLMRPRGGDFLYTPQEIQQMAMEIRALREAGADGFVIGCLTPEGELDESAMAPLLAAAQDAGVTLHRCIDVSRDPVQTYKKASQMGIDTVLTSGGAVNCTAGKENIGRMLQLRDEIGGAEVLIGAGVKASVIESFRREFPQARAFHMSGKTEIESGMRFRRDGVPMGLPGLDEWHIQQTDPEAVKSARAVLDAAPLSF